MKKILYILIIFGLFIVSVEAETEINDFKLEIVIDKDDIYKVKESFKTGEIDSDYYYIIKNNYSYDYHTNVIDFDNNYNEYYKDYLKFSLEANKEYYIEYKVRNISLTKGEYDKYSYYQIMKGCEEYNSVVYNNFNVVIELKDGRDLNLSDISNYEDIDFVKDGNVITGRFTGRLSGFYHIEIRKEVIITEISDKVDGYEHDDYSDNGMFWKADIPNDTSRRFFVYVPICALIINLVLMLIFGSNRGEIDGEKDTKLTKNMGRIMITITCLSYFISLSHRIILSATKVPIPFYFMVAFCVIIYWAFYKDMFLGKQAGFIGMIFAKIFIIFHSSIFAMVLCLGLEPFTFSIVILYFYIGFIINAINLDLIGRYINK